MKIMATALNIYPLYISDFKLIKTDTGGSQISITTYNSVSIIGWFTVILVGKNWHAPCRWWKRINFFCWVREHTLKTLLRPKENWQIGINWCTKEKKVEKEELTCHALLYLQFSVNLQRLLWQASALLVLCR